MAIDLLSGFTVFLSLITVVIVLYLIRVTKRRSPWIFLSIGLVVVASRRIIMFLNRFIESPFLSSQYLTPVSAFIMNILIFIGFLLVIPVIRSIKVSEERYRSIFDISGVSICEEDHYEIYMSLQQLKKDGVTNLRAYIAEHPEFLEESIECIKIVDANQATMNLFKARDKKVFLKNMVNTFTTESKMVFIDLLISVFNGENIFEAETRYKDLEGKYLDAIIKVADPEKKGPGKTSIVTVTDITARVQAEKKLFLVLEEKNTLLKELYHRTKNNMQVIIAMLNLRSYSIENETISTACSDMINRIQSMSLVHEKLYKSQNLSVIRLDEYIEDLFSVLINASAPPDSKIKPVLDLEPVSVDIDTAIPCGLILNELISNIFKHAFKNLDSGEIKISLHRIEGEDVEIVVTDNGNGLPAGFDIHSCETLGLQTVVALGEDQLHGNVDIVSHPGEKGSSWRLFFTNRSKNLRI